jgi:MFS family permease
MYAAMARLTATIADDVPLVVAALPWVLRTREAEPRATGRPRTLGAALRSTWVAPGAAPGPRVGVRRPAWGGGVLSDRTGRRRVFVAGVFTVLGALSVGRIRSVR